MGQIKKVVVHMTPNTSKNFTAVMLEIYDKYKDTDFFDDMKKKEENNTGVNQSFKLSVIVGIWESLNLHPTVMIYQSKRKYFLSMLHVSKGNTFSCFGISSP